MICPKCKSDVEMLKFTTIGVLCPTCHLAAGMPPGPARYRIPVFYLPPLMTPLYWRNEQSGELPTAVNAYLDAVIANDPALATDQQLKLVADYCRYFINAPCWSDAEELRERAKNLASLESIRRWIAECVDAGLDPF